MHDIDFVLDRSLAMAWCFEDESTPYSERVLDALKTGTAHVPPLWCIEISNTLIMAQRKKRLTALQAAFFHEQLAALPIEVDELPAKHTMTLIMQLAQETALTAYDAVYLELSLRKKLPLATLDHALQVAADRMQVPLLLR